MKIVINAFSARKGGILTYTRNLLRSLTERGVEVIAAVSEDFPVPEGMKALRRPLAGASPLHRLLWEQTVWPSLVRGLRPDLLFSSANFGVLASPVPQLLLMREGGLFDPFYLRNVSPNLGAGAGMMRMLRRNMMLASIRRADRVMTPTQALKDLLVAWQPSCADKTTVNHYGTLDHSFDSGGPRRGWREDGVLRLLFVSVYYPHKAPGDVCRLVERLEQRGIRAHATITMTIEEIAANRGGALDLTAVERLARSGRLTLGRRPYQELPDLYRGHDLFIFPAVAETFGHPLAEAMSCGIPVIAADTPVAREVCADNALYAEPFRIDAYLERVLALDADPALRQRLAEASRAHVLTNLRWQDHVDRLVDLFERTTRECR